RGDGGGGLACLPGADEATPAHGETGGKTSMAAAHLGENERGTGQVHLAGESLPATGAGGVRFVSAEPLLGPPPSLELGHLDWVISGGESGPRCRPCEPGWVRDLRDRCVPAGVAFFHKQWGGRTPKAGGRLLDGRTWDERPAMPRRPRSNA